VPRPRRHRAAVARLVRGQQRVDVGAPGSRIDELSADALFGGKVIVPMGLHEHENSVLICGRRSARKCNQSKRDRTGDSFAAWWFDRSAQFVANLSTATEQHST
jgi:hypothetical protein